MVKTKDQIAALELMKTWYEQDKELFCTVNGAAGTGKTTITKEFIQSLGLLPSKIAVSAPTHKAKKVIQKITGYTGTTIQKLLGLRPNTDIEKFDINRPQFDPLGKDEIQYYTIILLDESSMVNASIYTLLKKKAKRYGVKVLFLGDEYQLPPIGETISKVFSDVVFKATLTTVVRQGNDNPMSIALVKLREDVINGTQTGIDYILSLKKDVVNNKGFKCLPKEKDENFGEETFGNQVLQHYFSTEYGVNTDFMKFIAYTNESVELWSNAFRRKLLGKDADTFINVGESLLGYSSIINKKTNNLIIENSEEYRVTDTQEGDSPLGIQGMYVDIESEDSGSRRVFIVDPSNTDLFKQICTEKLNTAKNLGGGYWRSFYAFKESHLLLHNVYKDDTKPKKYWNLLCKKDVYYNYGVTVHKSQGSTYDNVAINLTNLFTNHKPAERARLLYVAFSRAKDLNLILI